MANVEMVTCRGVSMAKGWPEKIQAAQLQPTLAIIGKKYDRIPYGKEDQNWGADKCPCHDCGVIKDEFHVDGCDVERCPKCGCQLISCGCMDEEDEEV